jgi:hypothetical protein
MGEQLLHLSKDSDAIKHEQLMYLEETDDIVKKTYAYLAYRENMVSSGKWTIRIKGNCTAGTNLDPSMIEKQAQKAQGEGNEYFVWGFNLQPRDNDPRLVETRVFQTDGKATKVEVHLILRNADGSAKDEVVGSFDYPAE